jgi:hypothetical protein
MSPENWSRRRLNFNMEKVMNPIRSESRAAGIGSYIILAILLVLLIATAVVAGLGWSSAAEVKVSRSGYIAMSLGILFSLAFGIGLMALVFYSSRAGYDEPVKLARPDHDPEQIDNIR